MSTHPPDREGAAAPRFRLRLQTATLVRAACIANLLALALMVWSVLDPTPLPVMVAMSVGQVIGTIALGSYLVAVFVYQRELRRARARSDAPPPR